MTGCEICGSRLSGRQRKYCSKKCKNYGSSYPAQQCRGLARKLHFIERVGGCCTRCGFRLNTAVLSFHHRAEKSHSVTMRFFATHTLKTIEAEMENCLLLCANCHMELHYPHLDLSAISNDLTFDKPLNQATKNSGLCVVCENLLEGRQSRFCSTDCKNRFHQDYDLQRERGLLIKRTLVGEFGGACQACGYHKNLAALTFHHKTEKNFKLDLRNLANRDYDTVLRELESCSLLCANCHIALHNPHLEILQ